MTASELPADLLAGTAAVFSRGLQNLPHLAQFLGARSIVARPGSAKGIDYVIGWGHKPSARRAQSFAQRHQLPYIRLEDGFLRSTDPGDAQPPASLVLDPSGIYYDANTPSRLEALLTEGIDDPALLARAKAVIERVVRSRISKYNQSAVASEFSPGELPERFVLVVDQVAKDTSIRLGTRHSGVFEQMLEAAIQENPGIAIVIKAHPATATSREGGLTSRRQSLSQTNAQLHWFTQPVNPHDLLERADKVYVATSQLGFEALLHRKQVICFGSPFYAGWGLTEDRQPIARRDVTRTLAELVAAALLLYPRYVHPVTGKRCEVEDILEHFELQASQFTKNLGTTFCLGFWWWKRRHVRHFLKSQGSDSRLVFCKTRGEAERRGFNATSHALTWGQKASAQVESMCQSHGVSLQRMEDGFLRSVGLGSDLTTPWSLVVDSQGIYYDPNRPSDLEQLLTEHDFSSDQLSRAQQLRHTLLNSGISKYNQEPTGSEVAPRAATAGRKILVPGQVEADASVLLGSPTIRTNLQLLEEVRKHNPEAYIVFKPHPDVEAGNRPGKISDRDALIWCDSVVRDRPIAECLNTADELHTMTSLVGFEALLRKLKVVVYGAPFYAGWGLTEDRSPPPRRGRKLSLDELVAGTLLLYPRYVDPRSGYFCTAEQALERLIEERALSRKEPGAIARLPLRRPFVRAAHFLLGMVHEIARETKRV